MDSLLRLFFLPIFNPLDCTDSYLFYFTKWFLVPGFQKEEPLSTLVLLLLSKSSSNSSVIYLNPIVLSSSSSAFSTMTSLPISKGFFNPGLAFLVDFLSFFCMLATSWSFTFCFIAEEDVYDIVKLRSLVFRGEDKLRKQFYSASKPSLGMSLIEKCD